MKPLLLGFVLMPVLTWAADTYSAAAAVDAAASTGSLQGNLDVLKGGVDPSTGSALGIGTLPCGQVGADGQYHCGGQVIVQPTDSPPEAANYDRNVGDIQSDAQAKILTDDVGNMVLTSKVERPTGVVKSSDPLFANADQNDSQASALAQTYSGCKTMQYGGTGGQTAGTAVCYKTGRPNTVHCQRTWTASCNWLNLNPIKPTSGPDTESTSTVKYVPQSNGTAAPVNSSTQYVHHSLPYSTKFLVDVNMKALVPESIVYLQYQMWVANSDSKWDYTPHLYINGTEATRQVSFGPMGGKYWRYYSNFTGIQGLLHDGINSVEITGGVVGIEAEKMLNLIDPRVCEHVVDEGFACDAGIAGLQLISNTCQDTAPKFVSGNRFDRACWSQDEEYGHYGNAVFTEDATCSQLRSQGCYVAREDCLVKDPQGFCANAKMTFTCEGKQPVQTVDVCGDTLICTDGSCNQGPKDPDGTMQDFSQAASYLQAMKDVKGNFDAASLTVFKGAFHECTVDKTLIGTNQCCTGGTGFLNTVGASCTAEEDLINQSRNAAVVTALPQYETCGAHVLGLCVKWEEHRPYCVWPSKLARIIQDQGKAQLGIPIDSACAGFKMDSPNEFAQVDFSKIDLSEYFSDVQNHFNATAKPSPDALIQKMTAKMPAMTQELMDRYKDYGQ